MDYLWIVLILLACGVIMQVVKGAVSGPVLQRKFASLGDLRGKTIEEIEGVAGSANSRSTLANGKVLYQWIIQGYHIALRFSADGKCEGITSEYTGAPK